MYSVTFNSAELILNINMSQFDYIDYNNKEFPFRFNNVSYSNKPLVFLTEHFITILLFIDFNKLTFAGVKLV